MHQALIPTGGKIAVIGAGAAGLVTARALRLAGYQATVFERGSEIGGTWNYGHETSAMYQSLRCNIPKECMAFRELSFSPSVTASYLTHRDIFNYLLEYTARFALRKNIRFESKVESISRLDDNKAWEVEINNGEKHHFHAVSIANGHYSVPNPYYPPGTIAFRKSGKRTVTHSKYYRTPAPYKGRTVIVVGASASGTDISLELESAGAKVYLSHHDGFSGGKFADSINEIPTIKSLSADGTVYLSDGNRIYNVDDILLCTGYKLDLSFLSDLNDLGIRVRDGQTITGLVSHLICKKQPTLSIIGVPNNVSPFPMFEDQARFYTAALSGIVSQSCLDGLYQLEMKEAARLGLSYEDFHSLGDRQWEYRRRLARLTGSPMPSKARIEMYNDSQEARFENRRNYRERIYKLYGERSGEWTVYEEGAGKYEESYADSVPWVP